ncbi:MAG: heavy metal sensor histidine kinase [Gammaproteobacteria bacterium]|nr:heavy metal sensor histidine kinase [Gammaproteobacteria bacterium]
MKRPISLTYRLTLFFSIAATVVFLTFGWLIERSINEHFAQEDIKELKVIAQAVERALTTRHTNPSGIKQRLDDILIGHHGPLLHIKTPAGETLYRSPGPDLLSITESQNNIQLWRDEHHSYRVLIQQIPAENGGQYSVTIAVAIDFHLHFIKEFRYTLWLMVILGIIIMGVLSWVAVRQGHRPLHNIVQQISQTRASQLNARLNPEVVPAELTELAHSFNELLQRMEEAFNRLSNFSADIAHELRTPVTNLMTQTQVALSQARNTEEYQEILYSNIEEYERMAQMIGDMLFLAKADNNLSPLNTENINLKAELLNLFDYYEAWAEDCHVSLRLEGSCQIQGDRLMLRRALSNLLSNAIRHTPAEQTVTVQLEHNDNQTIVRVKNPGTPIPEEHLSKLFDRFYRVDPSRQRNGEGTGLGLAIVKSIIEAHGGTIQAHSNEKQTQFVAILHHTTAKAIAQITRGTKTT